MAMRSVAKQVARRLVRTPPGQRLLRLAEADGLLPGDVAHRAAPAAADGSANRARLTGEVDRLQQELDVLQELWDRNLEHLPSPSFDLLTEEPADPTVPPLDRAGATAGPLTDDQRHWVEHGYVLKEGFVDEAVVDAYWERRLQLDRPHGWDSTAPYMHVPEVQALSTYKPLNDLLDQLIGEDMAVSLNLTGIVSTERNWHQDDYLNPPQVNGWYAAAWFAMGDVAPESGPFQFVPGSHRWPVLRRDRVLQYLRPEERSTPQWPRLTERFLDVALEEEIARRGASVETFLGKKGDVLIWHSRLVHRGSLPTVPGTVRPSFIAHYTGVQHWPAGPNVAVHPGGGRYLVVDVPLDE